MSSSVITELAEIFKRFPGIGPRQARRFVYFLLQQDASFHRRLTKLIEELPHLINRCPACQRFFQNDNFSTENKLCSICQDEHRYNGQLLIVEKDADYEAVEKTGTYLGQYFILGGLIPILEKEPAKKIRLDILTDRIKKMIEKQKLNEIIFALAVTTEADHTIEYLRHYFADLTQKNKIKFSLLGRGLSGGLEIEYSDTETLKNALDNRH